MLCRALLGGLFAYIVLQNRLFSAKTIGRVLSHFYLAMDHQILF